MTHLTKQKEKIDALISDANFFNSKGKIDEVAKLLDKYIPAVAKMDIKTGKDKVSYVLVFKLSRFGRNAADVLSTLQTMQDFGGT